MDLQFSNAIWYKKGEELAAEAVFRNNILWIKKKGDLVIYVPYSFRHKLMTSAYGDLTVGHDGVKKCKELFIDKIHHTIKTSPSSNGSRL